MIIKRSFTSEQEFKETLDFIYSKSKEGKGFNGILEAAFNEITIVTAIHNIKSNKGANTQGIDETIMKDILQMDKEEVFKLVFDSIKNYIPKPVRRTYIKKSNGKMRPLGIPCAIEKIIQECIRIVIEPICEAKFYPESYGFRPFRSTKHALRDAVGYLSMRSEQKPIFVIEGDIEGFFDNINHKILLKKLYKIGVKDKRILMIIKQMLKAGYVYEGEDYETPIGAVQGGIISPLLANVYLNDFDWYVGRMYHYPRTTSKHLNVVRRKLKKKGIVPKYLIRYCDDWIIMTTMLKEAIRILEIIRQYFKLRLKLNISEEKTLVTDITQNRAKFLGFELLAAKPRDSPGSKTNKSLVGKLFPSKNKVKTKTDEICLEVQNLKHIEDAKCKAAQIEKINSIITGLAEYYKSSICTSTYRYMDGRINYTAWKIFKTMYGKEFLQHKVKLGQLRNRPQRHKGRDDKTFAVLHNNMYIGITKAYLTHSQWEKYQYNQKITPYSDEGRKHYLKLSNHKKKLPLDRPPIYEPETLFSCDDSNKSNFEYYMNREYAYNRDKGRCKICSDKLKSGDRHCHRKNPNYPIDKINKVPNLAWLCTKCLNMVYENCIPENLKSKVKSKLLKYLKVLEHPVVESP